MKARVGRTACKFSARKFYEYFLLFQGRGYTEIIARDLDPWRMTGSAGRYPLGTGCGREFQGARNSATGGRTACKFSALKFYEYFL